MDKRYSNILLYNNILYDNGNVSNDIVSWQALGAIRKI